MVSPCLHGFPHENMLVGGLAMIALGVCMLPYNELVTHLKFLEILVTGSLEV